VVLTTSLNMFAVPLLSIYCLLWEIQYPTPKCSIRI